MKLGVKVEITLPDDLDRVMSKGLNLKTFYAVKGNNVSVIRNGRIRSKDMPDAIIERLCGKRSNYTKMDLPQAKHMWDTFLDTANGEYVDSMDKMRERERTGQVFCSPDEASREAKRSKQHIAAKAREESSRYFRPAMAEYLQQSGTFDALSKMKRRH